MYYKDCIWLTYNKMILIFNSMVPKWMYGRLTNNEFAPKKILGPDSCASIYLVKGGMTAGAGNFLPLTLTSRSFVAPWAARMHSISFESSNQRLNVFCLVKSKAALLNYVFRSQNILVSKVLIYWYNISIAQHFSF